MTGETFIILLHGLISPALALQRIKLGLPHDKKALLLCDAWSGFHTFKGGLDAIRAAWSEQAHCVLPIYCVCLRARFALSTHEAGGFSANGQPIDQVHHLLRARLELVDADDIACESDLHRRPRYDALPIAPSGQPARPNSFNHHTLLLRTLRAWESVPRKACVAAWIVTGYFAKEHFDPEVGLSPEEATAFLDDTGMLRTMGIKSDLAGQAPKTDRWYWALKMVNDSGSETFRRSTSDMVVILDAL
ncbi:unnamed protein product [Durusdinium trenchii]|uniref:Uncharacterized protein n=1 Tax=Durusdinium trenchii TaxID=1381693 RepID=A0ABP0HS97_9DINO